MEGDQHCQWCLFIGIVIFCLFNEESFHKKSNNDLLMSLGKERVQGGGGGGVLVRSGRCRCFGRARICLLEGAGCCQERVPEVGDGRALVRR